MKLYHHGTFIPMTGEHDTFEALVVDGNMIAFTGSLKDAQLFAPNAERVDLEGRTMLPGIVDPHSHITMAAQLVTQADLTSCTTFADIQAALRAFVDERGITATGGILGRGYDQNDLVEGRHPDKLVLDQVTSDIPIFITHVSGHMGVANSKALELAGITAATPDPTGARFGRMGSTQEPSGYCEEPAAALPVMNAVSSRVSEGLIDVIDKVQDIYLSNGITTCQDGALFKQSADELFALAREGRMKLDVVAYPLIAKAFDGAEVMATYPDFDGGYVGRVRIGGYKILLDGSPQGRTAWMSEPYEPDESGKTDWCAYETMSDEEVCDVAAQAIATNNQLLAHCNGDAASEQFLRCYKQAYEESDNTGKAALRPVMIHCQTARRDQYERMSALNMIPSIFTSHIWYWGDAHLKNFGSVRGGRISAAHDALDCGLVYNFHTDCPIVRPNMLETIWCAVNRVTKKGRQLDEDQKVGVYDGLKAVTINAAYSYYEEDKKGTLEVGKLADLAILDENPLTADPLAIRDIKVRETIKEGETVWRR